MNIIIRGFKTEAEAKEFIATIKGTWDIVEIRDKSIIGEPIGYFIQESK